MERIMAVIDGESPGWAVTRERGEQGARPKIQEGGRQSSAAMAFNPATETIILNARLQIPPLKGRKFNASKGICTFIKCHALFIPGKSFAKFKGHPIEVPYTPIGGKKALQSVIEAGGFIEYDSLEFVNPIN